ncbi:MAG: amidohydrolase family protein [Deltaproteobacteria bacterium]|nr:amidohydrolase family protein [Deltaproteobacteria bacterium]
MIDAHQHFWKRSRGDYAWLTPDLDALYRDFGPSDLAPHLAEFGIQRTVAVQAAPTLAETEYLLDLADATPWVAGVVGWVDMASPAALEDIDRLATHPALCGLRPMIQDISDPDWMLREALTPALRKLVEKDLAFDALIRPTHLGRLLRLLARHPDLRVVIDHGAKPEISQGKFDAWARDMASIARESSAHCKLSGLVSEAAEGWTHETLRPYVDHLLECFGTERLLWGSDWPVSLLGGGYGPWREATSRLLANLEPAALAQVLGGNAERFYRLRKGNS